MNRIYVAVKSKEIEKPDGGGAGPEAIYSITISVDGKKVLYLTSNNFLNPNHGDMALLAAALKEISAPDLSSTIPPKKGHK